VPVSGVVLLPSGRVTLLLTLSSSMRILDPIKHLVQNTCSKNQESMMMMMMMKTYLIFNESGGPIVLSSFLA
jgi:hypothetical protein